VPQLSVVTVWAVELVVARNARLTYTRYLTTPTLSRDALQSSLIALPVDERTRSRAGVEGAVRSFLRRCTLAV